VHRPGLRNSFVPGATSGRGSPDSGCGFEPGAGVPAGSDPAGNRRGPGPGPRSAPVFPGGHGSRPCAVERLGVHQRCRQRFGKRCAGEDAGRAT